MNHKDDFFWVEKNPDKRYTKNQYTVLGRNNLNDDPVIHTTKLNLEDAKVMADLIHQIWWAETNQEEKEIERRKNIKLTPEQKKKHWENYGKWRVKYLKKFLKV